MAKFSHIEIINIQNKLNTGIIKLFRLLLILSIERCPVLNRWKW